MNVIIVDDEKKAREGIKILLSQDQEVNLIGEAKNGKEAINMVSELQPELIFLDIQMPGINGFDVLTSLSESDLPIVIFTTAYDQYALKAFEVHAVDYLLKPYSAERFNQALGHAKKFHRKTQASHLDKKIKDLLRDYQKNQNEGSVIHEHEQENSTMMVKIKGKVHFLKTTDIYWIEALDSYVKIHQEEHVHIVKASLKSIEARFGEYFIRIHRSHLVNKHRIRFMEPYFNGDFYLTLENNVKVRGSRNFKRNLPQIL